MGYAETDRRNSIPRGNRGAWAEQQAVVSLLEMGFDVFQNVSAHGPVDMIAMKDGEIYLLDVKSRTLYTKKDGSIRYANGPSLTPKQEEMGVRLLNIRVDTGEIDGDLC